MYRFTMFVFAFIFPPMTAIMTGSILQLLLNVVLTCCFILPGMIHAMYLAATWKEPHAGGNAIVINNNNVIGR